jgi:hypothetical protein
MKNATIVLMVLAAAFSRFIPHAPNVTAITALALLGGAYISPRSLAVLLPVAAMWISDLVLGFHNTMLVVYAATALIALGSTFALKNSNSWTRLPIVTVCASLFFFVVTNFAVWSMDTLYPHTALGLQQCFVMALPFLGNQVLGDLSYSLVLFGVLQAVRVWKPQFLADTKQA